ncbi:MAG: DUF4340 domain-containing protein [Treponema sp.]|nr:DUF4340 domain-containing protein [Treponema sp.]
MKYKDKLVLLLSLIAVLVLTYAASIIFGPDMGNSRVLSHVWLEQRSAERTTRIVISAQDSYELVKRNNLWFVLHNSLELPARELRVNDFLDILTTRSQWPVRSSNESSHERFGLSEELASRITIYGEYSVLLDLLVGNDDIFRNETYFRKSAQSEVRAGDSSIKVYLSSPVSSWYNLRLFPESENIDISAIQRLTVYNGEETQVFSRRNRVWEISGIDVQNPSQNNIENYIRSIINLEGDNFADAVLRDDPVLNHSRIMVEFGNGRIATIRLSQADESGRIFAHASGREYVYSLPLWSSSRLYRPASSFEMQ